MALDLEKRKNIFNKLERLLTLEDFCRIIYYLNKTEEMMPSGLPPAWKNLSQLIDISEAAFEDFAKNLANDTRTAEENPEFYKVMSDIYDHLLNHNDDAGDSAVFDLQMITEHEMCSASLSLVRAFAAIPPESQAEILKFVATYVVNGKGIVSYIETMMPVLNKCSGTLVIVGLAVIYLSWEALVNIKRWWNGEISGIRCAKNCIDATVTVAAGVGGGIAGAALGSLLGPIGTLGGSIIGSVLSANAAKMLSDYLTQKIFCLPKEEALEKAYNYLGLNMKATNGEINAAYRKLCLQHHPDKGGDEQEFHQLQYQMAVIKTARDFH